LHQLWRKKVSSVSLASWCSNSTANSGTIGSTINLTRFLPGGERVKKKDEIESKMEALKRRIDGTVVTPEARADSALFAHGCYEALAWVLEVWEWE
jgi:hypothetical protein